MKTRNVLIILVAAAVGFAITLVSGLYEQTLLPENLVSGTTETWYGFPFGWRGYSQVGHVFYVNPPLLVLACILSVGRCFLVSDKFCRVFRRTQTRKSETGKTNPLGNHLEHTV